MKTSFARIALVLAASLIASAGRAHAAAALDPSAFAYDASPPAVTVLSQRRVGDVVVREIAFASPKSGTIHAELMLPAPRPGTHGGVLFAHWLGDPATTNHTEFAADALALAKAGSATLSLDMPWSQAHWYSTIRTPATDYADSIRQVIDLRRALDVLLAQPNVDAGRIAFVGHDFGAMYGAVLSGVDPRARWYVLMAGNPSFSQWFLLFPKLAQPTDRPAYLAQMAQLDPPLYLARSKADEFLFQFADTDDYITATQAQAFAAAAPLPHGIFTYKTDHALNVPAAFLDRMGWLERRLNPPG